MYLRLRLFYPLLFHCWLLQIRKVPSILLSWNSHWQPWPASSEGCSVWLHWGHCPSISQHYRSLFQADLYTDLRYTIKVLFLEFPYIFFFRIPQNLFFLHYHRNNHPENLTILKNCFPLASLLQNQLSSRGCRYQQDRDLSTGEPVQNEKKAKHDQSSHNGILIHSLWGVEEPWPSLLQPFLMLRVPFALRFHSLYQLP